MRFSRTRELRSLAIRISQETLSALLSINVTYCLDRAANIPLG